MGVESIEVDQFKIRIVARTLPGKQFEVGRALRSRITKAQLLDGINAGRLSGGDTVPDRHPDLRDRRTNMKTAGVG
jgi:hypothetical protein